MSGAVFVCRIRRGTAIKLLAYDGHDESVLTRWARLELAGIGGRWELRIMRR